MPAVPWLTGSPCEDLADQALQQGRTPIASTCSCTRGALLSVGKLFPLRVRCPKAHGDLAAQGVQDAPGQGEDHPGGVFARWIHGPILAFTFMAAPASSWMITPPWKIRPPTLSVPPSPGNAWRTSPSRAWLSAGPRTEGNRRPAMPRARSRLPAAGRGMRPLSVAPARRGTVSRGRHARIGASPGGQGSAGSLSKGIPSFQTHLPLFPDPQDRALPGIRRTAIRPNTPHEMWYHHLDPKTRSGYCSPG